MCARRGITPCLLGLSVLCLIARGQDSIAPWRPLLDGKTLTGWKETPFTRHGKVAVEGDSVVLQTGSPMTGITFTGEFPRNHYEVRFEAMRRSGGDFFASLTLPFGESYFTWVLGGWGGDIVGISSIDGWDASDNETRTYFNFDNGRWYRFRIEVKPDRFAAWIDDQRVVNVSIGGRSIGLRPGEIKLSTPVGFASYGSEGVLRRAEYRALPPPKAP